MEHLVAEHRKQQRDLQSQITQKKKLASKKTRKSVNDECAQLEQQLKTRQHEGLARLENGRADDTTREPHGAQSDDADDPSDLLASIANASLAEDGPQLEDSISSPADGPTELRKPNRQKARVARRLAEQEAAVAQAAEEAAKMPDKKTQERNKMLEETKKRGLLEKEVAANGHCLYLAVADQMNQLQQNKDVESLDYKKVRIAAADYIAQHSDDFVAFLEEPLDEYLTKIRDTGEWGGQLELLALAKTYKIDINVLQGDGRVESIKASPAEVGQEAWLAYYRHGFGLGEHYNSLRKISSTPPKG